MTNIQYKVDDMTAAPMDVKQWVDTEVSEELYKCYFYYFYCSAAHNFLTVDL